MLWYLVRALLLPRSTPVVWIWSFAFLCLRAWKPHPSRLIFSRGSTFF